MARNTERNETLTRTQTRETREIAKKYVEQTFTNSDDLAEGTTNLYFTNERAQDAVGNILVDSGTIDFTYTDGSNTITAAVVANSITATQLASGINISEFTNDSAYVNAEGAQDAVGGILTDSASIDFTYNDGANTITAATIGATGSFLSQDGFTVTVTNGLITSIV